jgi:hypothetical protein
VGAGKTTVLIVMTVGEENGLGRKIARYLQTKTDLEVKTKFTPNEAACLRVVLSTKPQVIIFWGGGWLCRYICDRLHLDGWRTPIIHVDTTPRRGYGRLALVAPAVLLQAPVNPHALENIIRALVGAGRRTIFRKRREKNGQESTQSELF